MTDPRALLDAYLAAQRGHIAVEAFAALRAVLDLHQPVPAGTPDPEDVNCSVCLQEGDIANEHPDNWYPQRWPCQTVQAITTALGAK